MGVKCPLVCANGVSSWADLGIDEEKVPEPAPGEKKADAEEGEEEEGEGEGEEGEGGEGEDEEEKEEEEEGEEEGEEGKAPAPPPAPKEYTRKFIQVMDLFRASVPMCDWWRRCIGVSPECRWSTTTLSAQEMKGRPPWTC